MAKTYTEVRAQIARLQAEAEDLRQREVAGVVARIKEAVEHYGITAADLGLHLVSGRGKPGIKSKGKASGSAGEAKFADGTGNVWGGRGPRPAWLREALAAGRALEEFAVGGGSGRIEAAVAPAGKKTSAKKVRAKRTARVAAEKAAPRARVKKAQRAARKPVSAPGSAQAPEEAVGDARAPASE